MRLLEKNTTPGTERSRSKHFLVFPWPAFGHITPLLEFSRRLVAAGQNVTFSVSESLFNDMRTRKMISPADETDIRFVGLKDGVEHTFDEHISSESFLEASDKFCAAAKDLISNVPILACPSDSHPDMPPVDVIVTDMTVGDVPMLAARERNIPLVVFSPMAGFMTITMLKVTEDSPVTEEEDIRKEMKPDAMPALWKDRLIRTKNAIIQTDMLVVNSFAGLEKDFRKELAKYCPELSEQKVGFIGPITKSFSEDTARKSNIETTRVSNWLDQQAGRSVVYLSFGSIAKVEENQIREILKALVGLKRPFVWALRPTQQKLLPVEAQEAIKTQFETPNPPFLILAWAPQMTILKHTATRVFISHCGWNSTLEGISSGVPILAWPMFADQHGDADLVVSSGCGVRIQKVDMTGERVVGQEELTQAIAEVAQWDTPLAENSYFTTSQQLSRKALEAINGNGDSQNTFNLVLNLA